MAGRLVFAQSVDYARHTGGFVYNARLIRELEARGWSIERLALPAGFPRPEPAAIAATAEALAGLPDRTLVVLDQICFSPLPDLARREGSRLRFVVIVHHPMAQERGPDDPEAPRTAAMERSALAHATRVIVTSALTFQSMLSDYAIDRSRLILAPPGVDRLAPAVGSASPGLSLLSVGAVVPRKAHSALVDALAPLADRAWRLAVVGDLERAPGHVEAIRQRIRALGLVERVVLAGALDDTAMEQAWRAADLYVSASRHEGFGMAIAEAVARGLPVVTTDAGAVGGWLDRRAALVVPTGDEAALRDALRRVLDDPDELTRLRQGARSARHGLPRWPETARTVDTALEALVA